MNNSSTSGSVHSPSDTEAKAPYSILQKRKSKQSFFAALLAGSVVAALGAICWGASTMATGMEVDFIAVVIGFFVGFTIQKLGKGNGIQFNVVGGILTLIGCYIGRCFSIVAVIATDSEIGFFSAMGVIGGIGVLSLGIQHWNWLVFLFVGIGVAQAFWVSSRKANLTVAEDS